VDEEEPNLEEIPQATIMKMIRSLPEGYRTVFNLFVFEDKSHKEIAEILGIAENSSASQFHRAKAMLVQKIKEYKMSKTAQYE
jgi:RNA polymerase sigma-70 factor (ECF subfamily)